MTTTAELTNLFGGSSGRTVRALHRLTDLGVLTFTSAGWTRPGTDRRDAAARDLGLDGRLADRARRYHLERELWAWWQAEDAWMRAPRRTPGKRRPGRGQLFLLPEDGTHVYGPHPRRADGRLDWTAARHIIETERHGTAHRPHQPTKDPDRLLAHAERLITDTLGATRTA